MKRVLALILSTAMIFAFTIPPAIASTSIVFTLETVTAPAGGVAEVSVVISGNSAAATNGIITVDRMTVTLGGGLTWADPAIVKGEVSLYETEFPLDGKGGLGFAMPQGENFVNGAGGVYRATLNFDAHDAATANGTLVIFRVNVPDGATGNLPITMTIGGIENSSGTKFENNSGYSLGNGGNGGVDVDGDVKPSVSAVESRSTAGGAFSGSAASKAFPARNCHSIQVKLSGSNLLYKLEQHTNARVANGAVDSFAAVPADGIILRTTATIVAKSGESGEEFRVTFTRWGDVNGDGVVNSTDASLINRRVAGLENIDSQNFAAGNVNRDATLNSTDASLVNRFVAGLEAGLPTNTQPLAGAKPDDVLED